MKHAVASLMTDCHQVLTSDIMALLQTTVYLVLMPGRRHALQHGAAEHGDTLRFEADIHTNDPLTLAAATVMTNFCA